MSTISDIIKELKQLTDYVESVRLVTYFDVAGSTMFLYDYLITLGMEVDLVWSSKWTFMKMLYFAQRYLPFVDAVALCFLNQLSTTIDPTACKMVEKARGVLMIAGISLSELVLTLRVWAVWERSSRVGLVLSILFLLAVSSSFVVSGFFLSSLQFVDKPYPTFQGCFITSASRVVYMNWVILMAYEAAILVMIVIPGISAYRLGGDTALHTIVYRDGVIVYIYLLALSTINVIVSISLPRMYLDILWSVERCLHSILTSRVLLDIRAYGRRAHTVWADGITELHFDSEVINTEPRFARRLGWARIRRGGA
ncbi:hypothetical protein K443DRAFT_678976 [Laccaria amethystina LaAM-08-1]|uniref:DUF6533 domain-containing protein n=1 Tax=Laccaria amethystina LaAM-08-1 TaxID=1095629 RepID=A0A0C9X6J6_9AGAR|nr:hypothetical protein K443DRAFT_678976 [Laccaria amethystina LaAM-08-1]